MKIDLFSVAGGVPDPAADPHPVLEDASPNDSTSFQALWNAAVALGKPAPAGAPLKPASGRLPNEQGEQSPFIADDDQVARQSVPAALVPEKGDSPLRQAEAPVALHSAPAPTLEPTTGAQSPEPGQSKLVPLKAKQDNAGSAELEPGFETAVEDVLVSEG